MWRDSLFLLIVAGWCFVYGGQHLGDFNEPLTLRRVITIAGAVILLIAGVICLFLSVVAFAQARS